MNEQQPPQFNEPCQCSKKNLAIVFSIIITAIAISGGIYAFKKSNLKCREQKLESIEQLEQKITDLKNQVKNLQQARINNETLHQDIFSQQEEQRETPKNKTTDWSIYKDEKNKFEIEYPNYFIVKENTESVNFSSGGAVCFDVKVYDSYPNTDAQSFVQKKLYEDFGDSLSPQSIEWGKMEYFAPGHFSISASFKPIAGGYDGAVNWDYFFKDEKVYKVSLLNDFCTDDSYSVMHDKILQTFKFID